MKSIKIAIKNRSSVDKLIDTRLQRVGDTAVVVGGRHPGGVS